VRTDPIRVDSQALLRHAGFVRALARGLAADEHDADDVEQETWLAAIRRAPRFISIRGWLATVARRASNSLARRDRRRTARETVVARPERIASTAEIVEAEALRRTLVEAVLALDEPYRTAIVARFHEALPPREIAARLGVPVETVRTHVKRGLDRLRVRLDGQLGARSVWAPVVARLARSAAIETALLTGGIAMQTSTKIAIGAAAACAVAAALWGLASARGAGTPELSPGPSPSVALAANSASAPAAEEGRIEAREALATPEPTGPRLAGRVVDASGRGIAGARVVSYPDDLNEIFDPFDDAPHPKARVARSDADGRFSVAVDDSGDVFAVAATAPGFSIALVDPVRLGGEALVRLDPDATVEGTVRALDGAPVANAKIRWSSGILCVNARHESVTDEAGRYRIGGLASATWTRTRWAHVVVDAPGFAPFETYQPEIEDGRFDFWLPRGASVTGRVLDAITGAPVANARVALAMRMSGQNAVTRPDGGFVHFIRSSSPKVVTANEDGAFRFEQVSIPGIHNSGRQSLSIVAMARGYAPRSIIVTEGREGLSEGRSVTCDARLSPGGGIRGRVVDDGGAPVEGASVGPTNERDWYAEDSILCELAPELPPPRRVTDSDGRWCFPAFPLTARASQRVRFEAYSRDAGTSALAIELRPGEIVDAPDIVLGEKSRPRSAIVIVRAPDGSPIAGASVADAHDASPTDVRTGRDGRMRATFRSDDGPTTVLVRAAGWALTKSEPFTPSSASPPEVHVTLAPEHLLRGRVTWRDGSPGRDLRIYVMNGSIPASDVFHGPGTGAASVRDGRGVVIYAQTWSDSDGAFDIRCLPEGPYHVRADGSLPRSVTGGESRSVEVIARDLPTDAGPLAMTIEAELPVVTGAVEVAVVDSVTGKPVRLAQASLERGQFATRIRGRSDPALGTTRLAPAAPGKWSLRVVANGYASLVQEIAVGNDTRSVRVELVPSVDLRGRVRVPTEVPLDDANLWFEREDGEKTYSKVESNGAYRVAGLLPGGRYRVTLIAREGERNGSLRLLRGIEWLAIGSEGEERDLDMERAGTVNFPPATKLRGVAIVTNAAGEVVGRRNLGERFTESVSVRPGDYVVRAELDDGSTRETRVTVAAGAGATVEF